MDCFLLNRGGLGCIPLPRTIFDAEMVAGDSDEPISGLHRDDQLWNLFTSKNSGRRCENIPSRPAPVSGAADHYRRHLCYGSIVLESSGEAISQAEAVLRSDEY